MPPLLPEFPGLDGGKYGHWGNQNETAWTDDRWNRTDLGSVLCGVFRGAGVTVPRAVCLRLGIPGGLREIPGFASPPRDGFAFCDSV